MFGQDKPHQDTLCQVIQDKNKARLGYHMIQLTRTHRLHSGDMLDSTHSKLGMSSIGMVLVLHKQPHLTKISVDRFNHHMDI